MRTLFFVLLFILIISAIVGCSHASKTNATIQPSNDLKSLPVASITQTWSW